MIEAYPLHWPEGWPRTGSTDISNFGKQSQERAQRELMHEIELLNGTDPILSTNIKIRQDGLPYSKQRAPSDCGVAVYFKYGGKQVCMPCDRWSSVRENIWSIRKSIEAIRGIARWGGGHMVDRAFTGFQGLPDMTDSEKWWVVLGVSPHASLAQITAARNQKAMVMHPDRGGSIEAMQKINTAFERATRGPEL